MDNSEYVISDTSPIRLGKVSPNPFKDNINIQLHSDGQNQIDIHLLDVLGNKIATTRKKLLNGQNQIDMIIPISISNGIYLLQIIDENTNTLLTHKLIH